MPNWCTNNLTVRGKKEDVLEFKSKIDSAKQNDVICIFNTFIPMPEELENSVSPPRDEEKAKYFQEKYGASDWYDWQTSNWGIKWGCRELYYENEEPIRTNHDDLYDLNINYDTAWGPGDDALEDIFKENDKLSFFLTYSEPGMGFQGTLFVRNGVTEQKETIEYMENDIENVW